MAFTDPFIRRPVLASVISLLIVLLGIQAFNSLTIRQYPQMESALITVTTAYPGANAETIQGYITQPLQQSLASAEGGLHDLGQPAERLGDLGLRAHRRRHRSPLHRAAQPPTRSRTSCRRTPRTRC